MHTFKLIHPNFPAARLEFSLDLVAIDSVLNNGREFTIETRTGKEHRVLAEISFNSLVQLIDEAKAARYAENLRI